MEDSISEDEKVFCTHLPRHRKACCPVDGIYLLEMQITELLMEAMVGREEIPSKALSQAQWGEAMLHLLKPSLYLILIKFDPDQDRKKIQTDKTSLLISLVIFFYLLFLKKKKQKDKTKKSLALWLLWICFSVDLTVCGCICVCV